MLAFTHGAQYLVGDVSVSLVRILKRHFKILRELESIIPDIRLLQLKPHMPIFAFKLLLLKVVSSRL